MTADDFLAVIKANPNNPTPKLLFADWLEERGEESLALAFRVAARKRWRISQVEGQWRWGDLGFELNRRLSYKNNQDNWSLLDAFRRLAAALQKVGVPE